VHPNSPPPCQLQFRELPVELRVDSTDLAWIGEWVTRDRRGRFYSYSGYGDVAVWNADGSLLRTIGRVGQGPGEFQPGLLGVHVRSNGELWVFDSFASRWTGFDSSYRVLATAAYVGGGVVPSVALLDDGSFLDAAQPPDSLNSVTVTLLRAPGGAGSMAVPSRAFAPLTAAERRIYPALRRARRVAYAGGDLVWLGPPGASGRGYELELWSTSGSRLRTIRREAPWFPPGSDRGDPGAPSTPVPTAITKVIALPDGVLLVFLTVPNEHWSAALEAYQQAHSVRTEPQPLPKPGDPSPLAAGRDRYVEAIDTESGTVLATLGPFSSEEVETRLPFWWFQGTNTGYRRVESPNGNDTIRLMEVVLTARQ
jgi:hypothetical protein